MKSSDFKFDEFWQMNNPCNCGHIYTHITISLSIYSIFPSPQEVLKCPFFVNLYTQKKLLWFFYYRLVLPVVDLHTQCFLMCLVSFLQHNVFEIHSCCCIYQDLVPFYCFFFFLQIDDFKWLKILIYFLQFLLDSNCFKSCVKFLLYNEVNQLYMYIHPLLLGPLYSSPQPIRLI